MSSYRSRYPINGYRSTPSSNRTSLYLSSDYGISGLSSSSSTSYSSSSRYSSSTRHSTRSTDVSEYDRQFKRLLERTEKFTNRVERLHSLHTGTGGGYYRATDRTTGKKTLHSIIFLKISINQGISYRATKFNINERFSSFYNIYFKESSISSFNSGKI